MFEERVDLSNNMTWRQMIGVGVRRVVLARQREESSINSRGRNIAARRAELETKGGRRSESKGAAGGDAVAGRGRGERSDRG